MTHTQKKTVATGTIRTSRGKGGDLYRETCIRMDAETFEEVRQRAIKHKTSFGQQIRELVEVGLETAKEHNL